MPTLQIREATKSDASTILELIIELAVYEEARHEVLATVGDIESTLFSDSSTAHAFIGEEDGRAVALAVYFFNYSTWLGRNGLFLEDLLVSKSHRGRGYGKAMLAHLARFAVEKDCGRFEWNVLDWNTPAIDFYESLGAAPQSEWIGYRLTGESLHKLAKLDTQASLE